MVWREETRRGFIAYVRELNDVDTLEVGARDREVTHIRFSNGPSLWRCYSYQGDHIIVEDQDGRTPRGYALTDFYDPYFDELGEQVPHIRESLDAFVIDLKAPTPRRVGDLSVGSAEMLMDLAARHVLL